MHTPPMSQPEDPAPSLFNFPCEFPLKVMGRREDGFAQVVSEIARFVSPLALAG